MRSSRARFQLLLASVFVLEFAAAPAFAQSAEPYDPWEPFNRKMYAFHEVLDRHAFGPLAHAFGRLPGVIRKPLVNFSRNLGEPSVFVNDVLQFRVKAAGTTLGRFVMNSTVGVAGFLDPASHNHLPHHDNGFGTTLGRWGAQAGPYLFIPLLGPSDFRDAIGAGVGIFTNPLYYAQFDGKTALGIGTGVINGLNARLQADQALQTVDQTSTDPYATLRSFFLQNRAAEIHGAPAEPEALPDFDFPSSGGTGAAPETTPSGAATPPGAPPAVSEPSSANGLPAISGGANAVPAPEATPDQAPSPPASSEPPTSEPPSSAPAPSPEATPGTPPGGSPKWLVAPAWSQPEWDGPLRTAGGK